MSIFRAVKTFVQGVFPVDLRDSHIELETAIFRCFPIVPKHLSRVDHNNGFVELSMNFKYVE